MSSQTPPPTFIPVLLADTPRSDKFGVAVRADVVVASIALWTVKASIGRLDGIGADIAFGRKVKGRKSPDAVRPGIVLQISGDCWGGGRVW
jgi:hypothetical protein